MARSKFTQIEPFPADFGGRDDWDRMDFRYWVFFLVMAIAAAVDFFDFFLAGFIMSKVGVQWQLTYGQVTTILLGTGIGSIIGSLLGGLCADRFGRRGLLIWSNLACGIIAGSIALIPNGAWLEFAILRFLSGLALGASSAVVMAYVIERTPGRLRTLVIGLNMVAPSAGIGLAGMASGALIDSHGWRAVAAVGAAPVVVAMLLAVFVQESVPWLISRGRINEAERVSGRMIGPSQLARYTRGADNRRPARLQDLFTDRRRFWLVLLICAGGTTGLNGVYLWGPSILALVTSMTAAQAGRTFAITSLFGIAGKLAFAVIPQFTGRKSAAVASSFIGGLSLLYAATTPEGFILGMPTLMVAFLIMALFLEGGYANIFPYVVEAFPVSLGARGAGLAQAGVGAAKILGPLSLTVIAGSGNVVKPEATANAILPAFIFLGSCALVSCLSCGLLVRSKEALP